MFREQAGVFRPRVCFQPLAGPQDAAQGFLGRLASLWSGEHQLPGSRGVSCVLPQPLLSSWATGKGWPSQAGPSPRPELRLFAHMQLVLIAQGFQSSPAPGAKARQPGVAALRVSPHHPAKAGLHPAASHLVVCAPGSMQPPHAARRQFLCVQRGASGEASRAGSGSRVRTGRGWGGGDRVALL